MPEENSELRNWFYAFLSMLALSLAAYAASIFGFVVFNQIFEISIFYVPTVILAIIVLYIRVKSTNKTLLSNQDA